MDATTSAFGEKMKEQVCVSLIVSYSQTNVCQKTKHTYTAQLTRCMCVCVSVPVSV